MLIRGGGRIARGDRHGNREAKKPKKLKPKEIGLISTLASIQACVTAHRSAGRERSPGLGEYAELDTGQRFCFLCLFGVLCTALIVMIEVPSNHPTNLLAGWFRDGGLPRIADWLSARATEHFIRRYAVWGLAFTAFICFFGVPLWHIVKKLFRAHANHKTAAIIPNMKISDAIDYIVNDSMANLDKPIRPESLGSYPPGTVITVCGAEHQEARKQLSNKLNCGELKSWGLRQIKSRRHIGTKCDWIFNPASIIEAHILRPWRSQESRRHIIGQTLELAKCKWKDFGRKRH